MRPDVGRWVLLSYRLPREPSAPRLAVWRKVKQLGAAQLLDGLIALPLDSRNREQLEWLADEVVEASGEAAIWIAEPATAAQERELAGHLQATITEHYRAIAAEARQASAEPAGRHRRTLSRLRRELGRVRRRDYFPPTERDDAERAVEALATRLDDLAA
jgi:Protein ChrB, N-terminal